MRQLGYYFFKGWVSLGLFCYYKRIRVHGLENVPRDKPVLFLSNHQNALMDILLIATRCNRKPWYLTRADVFKSRLFSPLFRFLQMLPVYRIRDGRESLSKNSAIFERCAHLLLANQAILLFPEANHSLLRRVRPLSKGFTRIIENALKKNSRFDIQLVPIGQNYQEAEAFGDQAALYIGKSIPVQSYLGVERPMLSLKEAVFESLKQLTTHIEPEKDHEEISKQLIGLNANFLHPKKINSAMAANQLNQIPQIKKGYFDRTARLIVYLINFPMVLFWRAWLKPKVPEPEFTATFRFGFLLLGYPVFCVLFFLFFALLFGWIVACSLIFVHLILSLLLR